MILVKTGNGQGKTTSAVGLAVRAAGHGMRVLFIQFLKDESSGEVAVLKSIPGVEVHHPQHNFGFVFQMTDEEKRITATDCETLLYYAATSDADMIVLDEILHALDNKLITRDQLENVFNPEKTIILTGYRAPEWIIEKADYVSDVEKVKHPFDKGVQAQKGIEF